MNEVNNISRSFADNVNYLAELDKQYYTDGFIKRNGIQLGTQEYFGKVTMNVFDKSQKKHIVSDIISGSIVGNSGLEQFFLDMKTSIETLYNDVVVNVVVSNGTGAIADKNINITLSSTDTIIGLIQVDISMYIAPGIVADYTKYSILSASNEYIAILPYLSTLDDDFNNSILSIAELSDEIKIVSDNSAGITSVANTVVPNINEILLVDTRAIEAANSATSANESMIVANASRDSAISSAMLAEASRIAAELSESNSKASELSSLAYKDIALSSFVSANESKTIAISKALEASSSATSADTSSVSASLSANIASDKANEAISSAVSASQKAIEANASANIATSKASEATNSSNESLSNSLIAISKASEASASALEAINAKNAILGMEVATGSPGSEVAWDGNTLTVPAGFDGDSIKNVTSNKVLNTTTVTISGTFANSPYSFNIEDGVDGIGDMNKSVYDTNNSGVVDNAEKVNGLTVETAVPAGALFTDTIVDAYTKTESDASLNSKQDTLVTGENIKSVNNTSLLGSGNLEITVGSGGYSANVYLTTLISSTVGAYNQISYTPEPTQTILSSTVNNNEVLIADYIFDGDVSATAIPAGEWAFHFHRRVSNTHGTSFIRFEIFKRSSTGDETVLFSHLSHSIENIVFEQESILVTQPIFTVTETDRIGIKLYASTTRDSDTVIDIAIGDGIAAYFTTPLEIRHNQLRARDASDAHPIGSITGLATALSNKVDKVVGKQLSTEDYTAAEKSKLSEIASGAQVNVPTDLSLGIATATTIPLNSSTGNDVNLPSATTTTAGLLSAADKTKLDSVAANSNNYTLPTATSTVKGGIEIYSDTVQSVASNTVTATANRTYGVQLNSSGQAVVNIPWTDTDTIYTHPNADGSLHVPATETTSNGKVLMAGSTAGSISWQTIPAGITNHTLLSNIGTNTHAQIDSALVRLAWTSGTNTGDETLATIKAKLGISTLSGSNTGDQTITLTGDVTGSGTNSFIATLKDTGTAGTYKIVTTDAQGRVISGTNPTTLAGYGITDVYTKTEIDNALLLKVDTSYIASLNLDRADKYLATQVVANMVYNGSGKLSKVQYNNATDVEYEVLTYNSESKLSNVAHYTSSTLRGNTVLNYSAGKLVSAIYTGV